MSAPWIVWFRARSGRLNLLRAQNGEISLRMIAVAVILIALVSIYPDLPGKFLAWIYNAILDASDSVGEKTNAHPPEPAAPGGQPERP